MPKKIKGAGEWLNEAYTGAASRIRTELSKPVFALRADYAEAKAAEKAAIAARPDSMTVELTNLEWKKFLGVAQGMIDNKVGMTKFVIPEELGEVGSTHSILRPGSGAVSSAAIWSAKKLDSAGRASANFVGRLMPERLKFEVNPRAEKSFGTVKALSRGRVEITFPLTRSQLPEEQMFPQMIAAAQGRSERHIAAVDAALAEGFVKMDAETAAAKAAAPAVLEQQYQKDFGALERRVAANRYQIAADKAAVEAARQLALRRQAEKAHALASLDEAYAANGAFDIMKQEQAAKAAQDRLNAEISTAWEQAQAEGRRREMRTAISEAFTSGVRSVAELPSRAAGLAREVAQQTRQDLAPVTSAMSRMLDSVKPRPSETPILEEAMTMVMKLKPGSFFQNPIGKRVGWAAAVVSVAIAPVMGVVRMTSRPAGRAAVKDAAIALRAEANPLGRLLTEEGHLQVHLPATPTEHAATKTLEHAHVPKPRPHIERVEVKAPAPEALASESDGNLLIKPVSPDPFIPQQPVQMAQNTSLNIPFEALPFTEVTPTVAALEPVAPLTMDAVMTASAQPAPEMPPVVSSTHETRTAQRSSVKPKVRATAPKPLDVPKDSILMAADTAPAPLAAVQNPGVQTKAADASSATVKADATVASVSTDASTPAENAPAYKRIIEAGPAIATAGVTAAAMTGVMNVPVELIQSDEPQRKEVHKPAKHHASFKGFIHRLINGGDTPTQHTL